MKKVINKDDKREIAKKLWLESNKELHKKGFLKEIAKQLNVSQSLVYRWKKTDKWEVSEDNRCSDLYERLKYQTASDDEKVFLKDLNIDEIKELKRTIRECDLYIINYEKKKSEIKGDEQLIMKYDGEIEKKIKIKIRCIENLLKIEKVGREKDVKINVKLV